MITTLLSELKADAMSSKLFAAASVGVVMGILIVVPMTSFSILVFSGPMASLALKGAGLMLFGSVVLTVLSCLVGDYKSGISTPLPVAMAVLSIVGVSVGADLAHTDGKTQFMTMATIMGITALASGAVLLFIGRAKLTNYLRFLPYPVVAGFLAGLGWVLAIGGLEVMVGGGLDWADAAGMLEADMLWLWVPGLAYALVLFLIGRRWSHFLIMPGSIVLCAALYHVAMAVAGVSLMEAEDLGILLPEGPSGNLWPTAYVGDLGRIDWAVVGSQIPGMLTVVLVTLIAVLTNTSAIEFATGVEIDLDKDFRNAGIGNLAIALGGSAPGHYAVSLSVASRTAGAYSRLTGIMAAIVVCYVLFFGTGTIELIPLAMLGGLVLYLGLELLYTWGVSVRKKLPLVDYGIAVLILGVIATRGFLAGMGVGLAAAIFFFAMRLSRTDPVQAAFTGRGQHRQSRRQRSLIHRAILSELGDRLHTYHLRGYMFFGIASPLVERLKSALRSNPPPQCVLLDFTAVTGFDVSAATALHRFTLAAKSQGTEVVFSAVPEHFEATLATIVPGDAKSGLHFEDDLDRGLERCEDIILYQFVMTAP